MMNCLYKFFTVVTLLPLLFSCQQKDTIPPSKLELRDSLIYEKGSDIPFTGREYARIDNKIIEYDVINGIKNGEFRLYYENGKLEIKGNINNNLNEGRWQYFYESGQVESEGDFVNNLPYGLWKWYYRSGNLREEGKFLKGERIGEWKQYNERGEVIEERVFSLSDSINSDSDHIDKLKNKSKQ